jgi:2-oxoisovalerate dehydrogenase E1 component alpha subunit
MASLIVVESALGQFVDDAAQIWAEATAKRDNDPEIAPLALSRPVIDAVLSSSVRSRLLVAVDTTGHVVGFTAVGPSAGESDAVALPGGRHRLSPELTRPRWVMMDGYECPRQVWEVVDVTTQMRPPVGHGVHGDRPFSRGLMPAPIPVQFLDALGHRVQVITDDYPEPAHDQVVAAYRAMVVGRRFDIQATALTKQGRLAVYPSSHGQEACQVASMLVLSEGDWAFPTYRESMALVTRGLDPVEVLTLLRGSAHCGYDPKANRTAPQCTPLATQLVHAVGFAYGEQRKGRRTVAMAFVGDGGTSEGDFHEALNFAAVFKAPVVFLVQNNQYAISVPLAKQSAAPSLGYKGIGYGIASEQVDGNDAMAMLAVLNKAVAHARSGQGPVLVEAHTYRLDAHTNADDATRYRDFAEVGDWLRRDPIARLEVWLRHQGLIDDTLVASVAHRAEAFATDLRDRLSVDLVVDPMSLFNNVFATSTPQLLEQRAMVEAELEAEAEAEEASP